MSTYKYPLILEEGDRVILDGTAYEVEALRDSVANSFTGRPDVAIDLKGQDWSYIVPPHSRVEVEG